MSQTILGIAGCRVGSAQQYNRRSFNLIMAAARGVPMKSRKISFIQLPMIAYSVMITGLLSLDPVLLLAAEDTGIETLLELEPLDWYNINPSKVVDECTLALTSKSKLKEDQLCRLYFIRGIAFVFVGKNEDAVCDLTELLKRRPNDCRALRFRGQIYDMLGQYDHARADFETIIKLQPKSAIGYACLALCMREIGDIESGKKFADKAIALDPDEPQGYLERGLVHMKENNIKAALKDINQCIALSYGSGTSSAAFPFQVRAAILIGYFDNPKKGYRDLLMARSLDSSDVTTMGMFCEYYFKSGKYNMAFRISEQLEKEHRSRPDMLHMRVYCLMERKRHDEALQLAESIIRREPRWWGSYLCRGQLFFAQKKYKEALQDYDKSLELHHDHTGAMAAKAYLLASCPEVQFRDGPTARTLATKCCDRTANQVPRHLMLLAMACAECGDYKEAVRLAKKSLENADSSFPYLADYRRRLALFEEGKPYRFVPDSRTFDYLFP